MKFNAMVGQIEWGARRRGDNDGAGLIHALFYTFAAAIYKWRRSHRLMPRRPGIPEIVDGETPQVRKSRFPMEANEYPSILAMCVSPNLEMMRRICHRATASRRGHPPTPYTSGDHFATFAWGACGMTHLHSAIRAIRSPMTDLAAKGEKSKDARPNSDFVLSPESAEEVEDYRKHYFDEIQPSEPEAGDENKVSAAHNIRKTEHGDALDPCASAWEDIRRILGLGGEDSVLSGDARVQMAGLLSDFSNMLDRRDPYSGGPPSRNQPCAKFTTGAHAADIELTYFGE